MYKVKDFTKQFYKPGEVAKFVDLHVRTIQGYCDSGKLDSIRSSHNVRLITKASLLHFLRELHLLDDDRHDVLYINNEKPEEALTELMHTAITKNLVDVEIVTDDLKQLHIRDLISDLANNKVQRVFVLDIKDFGPYTTLIEDLAKENDIEVLETGGTHG